MADQGVSAAPAGSAPTQGGAASAGMLNAGGRIEAVATFAGGPQASMQQLAVPMTAAAQSAPVTSTSATSQYTASAAPTAAAAPRTTHVAQHLSGKNLAMMQRSAAPVSVPATAAASAPTAPVVRVDPLHSGKHAGSLPPPRPGVPRSGKEPALLARGGPPAPTPAPRQPDVLVRAAMASDSENLEHAYPLLQRIAQEFDPSVTLSKAVADELLKSTTPLIKSVMAFSAQIAKRRTPGTAGTRVTIDDMRLAVGSLYPHLSDAGAAAPIPHPPVVAPGPVHANRLALKRQRLNEDGQAATTSPAPDQSHASGGHKRLA